MKVNVLLLISAAAYLAEKSFCKSRTLALSRAFDNITQALVDSNCDLSAIFVTSDQKSINPAILEQSLRSGVPFSVRHSATNAESFELNTSAIISVESFNELEAFNENAVLTNKYSKTFQFFIHCDGVSIDELSKLEENHKTKAILQFEYFFVDQEEFILLMTFVWHTATACNQPQLFEVNRFSKVEQNWKKKVFKLNKFKNFHGCNL